MLVIHVHVHMHVLHIAGLENNTGYAVHTCICTVNIYRSLCLITVHVHVHGIIDTCTVHTCTCIIHVRRHSVFM